MQRFTPTLRHRLATGGVVITSLLLGALTVACLPPKEANLDGVTRNCLPSDPTCSSSGNIEDCLSVSTDFCTAWFEDNEQAIIDEADAQSFRPRFGEPEIVDPVAASAPVCQNLYANSCGTCGPWTVESCAAWEPEHGALSLYAEITAENVCDVAYHRTCPAVFANHCPALTGARSCGTIVYGGDALFSIPEACRPHYERQCDDYCVDLYGGELPTGICPAVTNPREPVPADFVAACTDYVVERCVGGASVVECPEPSLDVCGNIGLFHEVCADNLTAGCEGIREERCPALPDTLEINLDNCVEFIPLAISFHPYCEPWLETTCNDLMNTFAEQEFQAQQGCEGTIVWTEDPGEAFDYEVLQTGSFPGEFDCETPEDGEFGFLEQQWITLLPNRDDPDGTKVFSCEEFVFQRFFNYEDFRRAVKNGSHDARFVFDVAYSEDPARADHALGTRALTTTDGPRWTIFPGGPHEAGMHVSAGLLPSEEGPSLYNYSLFHRGEAVQREKNSFVRLAYGSQHLELLRQELADRGSATAGVVAKATSDRLRYYWPTQSEHGDRSGWAWHKYMSDGLKRQGVTDAELTWLFSQRQRFAHLLDEYELAAYASVACAVYNATGGSQEALDRCVEETRARRDALLAEIEGILIDADRRGCFDVVEAEGETPFQHEPSPCDWAPEDFVEEVVRTFEQGKHGVLAACREIAAPDLAADIDYPYLSETDLGDVVWRDHQGDPRRNVIEFELYLVRKRQTVEWLPRLIETVPVDTPLENRPKLSDSWGDTHEWGKRKWFAAGLSYGASYDVDAPFIDQGVDVTETHICQMNLAANTFFDTYLYMFDRKLSVIDARADVNAQQKHLATHLKVAGVNVWGFEPEGEELNVDYTNEWSYAVTGEESEAWDVGVKVPIFSIGIFDLTVELGSVGRLGLEYTGSLEYRIHFDTDTSVCDNGAHMTARGQARPFIDVAGKAEVRAGIPYVAEGGVRGKLNLIRASLPASAGMGLTWQVSRPALDADLNLETDVDLEFEVLGGRVYAFVETLLKDWSKTIYEHPPIERHYDLLTIDYEYNLGSVELYCSQPQVDCY